MRWIQRTANWLRSLFHRNTVERELNTELRFHLERQIEENIAAGMSPQEARRMAVREFGGVEQVKEECRDTRRAGLLEAWLQDLRFAARLLRKNPGFTTVAVLTLALGIGANTAIFSMVNALLLRPYDFRDLDSLVRVWENRGIDDSYDARWIAAADATDFLSSANVFENLATYRDQSFNFGIEGAGRVEPVLGCRVSASFFDVLGIGPALGRGFSTNEDQPGSDQVVVIGDGLWHRRFAGDPATLGKTVQLNGRSYTVIGIMPPKFSYPVPSEIWVPLALSPAERVDRANLSLQALGRLKPGVSLAAANSALAAVARRIEQEFPKTNAARSAMALQLRKELYLYTLPLFSLLQAAAGFVLLLACANLANLVFARIIGRQKEIAMRSALGAGRGRLAQLFLCETLLLSSLAGIAAVSVSFWSVRLLRTSISQDWTKWVPGWNGIQVDRTVLTFTILLALAVGVLFGLATVVHAGFGNLGRTLKEAGPGSMTRAKGRLRGALVVSQVVFALVLLVCAGLTIQGFLRLADVYAGLQPANVLRVEFSLPEKSYADPARIENFYQQLLHSTAALQGVANVALASNHPASNVDNDSSFFTIEGRTAPAANLAPSADLQTVSAGYFPVLRIPLLAGRDFLETDDSNAPAVVIINQGMAQQDWPGEDAIGKRIKLGKSDSNAPWLTVVGVAGDIRQNWWDPPSQPTVYRPFLQSPERSMATLLRSNGNPIGYVSALRAIVRQQDPNLALRGIVTLQAEVDDSIGMIRIMGILMGVFGLVALALSSVGVYGVMSESIAQRTREIGIRVALGANRGNLMKLVLGQALKLTVIGLLIAIPASVAVSRIMANLVFGVVAPNYMVLGGFSVLLLVVALAAGYFPARRALRIDPMTALRYE